MSTWLQQGHEWINLRLERRIVAYSVAASLSISLVFGTLALAASLWLVRQNQRLDLDHRLDRIVAQLDDKADVFVRNVRDLSKNPLVLSALLDSKGRSVYLAPFFTHYRIPLTEPQSLALCDFEGTLLAQQDLHPVGCLAEQPQSRTVIDTEQLQAEIVLIAQKPHLALFQPVFYPATGHAEGYILATLDLQALVAEKNLAGPNATLMLHSPDGTLDFASRASLRASSAPSGTLPTRPLFATGPFATAGLTLAFYEPSTLFTGFGSLLWGYGLGTLALVALTLALARRLAYRLAEPLLTLNHTARRITVEGPSVGLARVDRSDEIGELAKSFNHMVVALRQAQEGLEAQVQARTEELQQVLVRIEQSEEQTRAILDSVSYHIAVLDRDGVIVAVNEPWRRIALANKTESIQPAWGVAIGVSYREVCRASIGEAAAAWDGIQAVLTGQRSFFSLDYPRHSPQEQRWFVMRVTPLSAERGGAVIAHADTTHRKQVEMTLERERVFLKTLVQTIPDLIWLKDPEGVYLACNPRFEQLYGAKEADILGKTDDDFVDRALAEFFRTKDRAAIAASRSCTNEEELTFREDGHRELVETIKTPMLNAEGQLIGVLGIARNITDARQTEAALRESESRFHTLVDLLPCGALETDLTGRVIFANPVLERLYGYEETGSVVGRFIWDFLADENKQGFLRNYLQSLVRDQPPPMPYFAKNRRADGSIIDTQADWSYRRNQHGQLQGFIAVVTDITERKQLQAALQEQAIRDPLTGLFNRRYLDETLPRELSRCQRNGEPLVVAMLDLDHFKRFNDTYGHEAGDAVLRAIGDLLGKTLRASDLACRYGGEELTLILHGSTLEDAKLRLDSLRRAVRQTRIAYRGGELPAITVSIGVTAAEATETDAMALLNQADAALYQAKAQGRNRVVAAVGGQPSHQPIGNSSEKW